MTREISFAGSLTRCRKPVIKMRKISCIKPMISLDMSSQVIVNDATENELTVVGIRDSTKTNSFYSTLSSVKLTIPQDFDYWSDGDIRTEIKSLKGDLARIFDLSWRGDYEPLLKLITHIDHTIAKNLVNLTDSKGRSALHYASAFSHATIVELLLSRGADPNAVNSTTLTTPLICSAINGNQLIMKTLLEFHADINQDVYLTATNAHTALQSAVKVGNLASATFLLENGAKVACAIMKHETSLHEAVFLADPKMLKLLLHYGSDNIELKGGELENTPLHLAVSEGRTDCIELLLESQADPNNKNIEENTALHLAAINQDYEALELLLRFGGDPNALDLHGRTPLHRCISVKCDVQKASECIELLLKHGADLGIQDELGSTVFHLALHYEEPALVSLLLHHGADLSVKTNTGQSGLDLLVKHMPHAIRYVKESLDSAISFKGSCTSDPACTLSMNFRAIVTNNSHVTEISKCNTETKFLLSLSKSGYEDILTHPLIEAFLILKWQKVRKFFWISFTLHLIMTIVYSIYLMSLYRQVCPLQSPYNSSLETNPDWTPVVRQCWKVLLPMLVLFSVKELVQMIQFPKTYFLLIENYIQLLLIGNIIATMWPVQFGMEPIAADCFALRESKWEYRFASVGILIAWLLVLIRTGKLPRFGLYVHMILKVTYKFGLFMAAYSSILIAFALSFTIQFNHVPEFTNLFVALQNVLIMMTGEVKIETILPFVANNNTPIRLQLPFVTPFIFITFILLVTIILMNLLVGLAVSDIQGLYRKAKTARLSRLVFAISQLESMLYSKLVLCIIPNLLKIKLRDWASVLSCDSYNQYNQHKFNFRPHDSRDRRLPRSLQIEALNIVEGKMDGSSCVKDEAMVFNLKSKQIQILETEIKTLGTKIDDMHRSLKALFNESNRNSV